MTEKMRQLTYLRAVLQADRADIAAYDELYRRQKMAADELDLRQAELDRTREQQLRQLAALKESVAKKQSLLYNIREKKEYYQSLAAELEAAATELKRIALARRKASRAPQGSLEEHRGRLPMPAKGVVVRFFGRHRDRRFNTVTESRGIDIQAPPGTEVHSVFAGTVIFADWLRGYGNLVIVDHGEGYYTVYAHLQEMLVAVDRKLGQHEVLGLVGDTDSLAGPRLHFEIRRHGSPLDPLEWVSPMG
jgi:septal ring factor EnvC (AmiA/AmiB activator)